MPGRALAAGARRGADLGFVRRPPAGRPAPLPRFVAFRPPPPLPGSPRRGGGRRTAPLRAPVACLFSQAAAAMMAGSVRAGRCPPAAAPGVSPLDAPRPGGAGTAGGAASAAGVRLSKRRA